MNLIAKLDAVLSHLNAEENELALEFRKALEEELADTAERLHWLECLESAGVDNWSGIDHAHDEYREALKELGEEAD